MLLERVVIVSPGGNHTALVLDNVPREKYKEVNDYILAKDSSIEQVMFVKKGVDGEPWQGLMAGGEFCGNATRALAYFLLGGKDGGIKLSISGAEAPLEATIKDESAKISMPIIKDPGSVNFLSDNVSLVKLQGITHLVLEPNSPEARQMNEITDTAERKSFAEKLLKQHELNKGEAGGVMFLAKDYDGQLQLAPFVYVREVDTFFAETACGSGSVAVGLALAKRRGESVESAAIFQPSTAAIVVNVDFTDDAFNAASIEGKVKILSDGAF